MICERLGPNRCYEDWYHEIVLKNGKIKEDVLCKKDIHGNDVRIDIYIDGDNVLYDMCGEKIIVSGPYNPFLPEHYYLSQIYANNQQVTIKHE